MAFIKSSRPTISTRNDWRAGTSKAFTTPIKAASRITSLTVTRLVSVRNERMTARIIELACVATMMLRRSNRSATSPPIGPSKNIGNLARKSHGPQKQRRTCQPVDQPSFGNVVHPGAHQRDHLPAEEKLEIAVFKRAHHVAESRTVLKVGAGLRAGCVRLSHRSIVRWDRGALADCGGDSLLRGLAPRFENALSRLIRSRVRQPFVPEKPRSHFIRLGRLREKRLHARRMRRYGQSASRKKISPSRGLE